MKTFSIHVSNSLRGIMQIGIVMSHLHFVLDRQVFAFMLANKVATSIVAMFLFISGYGLMYGYKRSIKQGKNPFEGFLKRRMWGILKAFLFITGLYLLVQYSLQGTFPQDIIYQLIRHGITPLPNAWFIFILLGLYTSFFILFRRTTSSINTKLIQLFAFSLALIIIPMYLDYGREWWATTLAFTSGALYAEYEEEIFTQMHKWWVLLVTLCFIPLVLTLFGEVALPLAFIPIPIIIIKLLNLIGYSQYIDTLYSSSHKSIYI